MRTMTLLRHDLVRSGGRLAGVAVAVAASVAVLVVLASVGLGLYEGVVRPLLPRLPINVLKVEPRAINLGPLAFEATELTGGLDERTLATLRRIDGVSAVYPIVGMSFPMRATGGRSFLGREVRTDVFATGLAEELVAGDVARGYRFVDDPSGEVPVLVARRLLELYNTTVAPAIEQRRLSPEAVIGFQFQIVIGSSLARGTPDPSRVRRYTATIVGLSDQANIVGLTVPEATLRRWNQEFGRASPLTGAFIKTRSPQDVASVARQVERIGLAVDDAPKIIGTALAIGGGLFGLFSLILLSLAAFSIAQTFFRLVAERRLELTILRALGARRRDLRHLVLVEAAVVGFIGGLAGTLVGSSVAHLLAWAVDTNLPELPFEPARIVVTPIGMVGLGVLLGVVASVLGAWWPANRAASADPATALRQ